MSAQDIIATLRAILGNDNAARAAAEQAFQEAKRAQPLPTVTALFGAVAEAQLEEPVREQAAVLLRQALSKLREEGSTWSQLGEGYQAECKAKLLELVEKESQGKVRRKLADIVQSLGNGLIDIEDDQRPTNAEAWPELMPTLMRIVVDAGKPDENRADTLWAVKELMASVWQIMVANTQQTLQVLKSCYGASSEAVRAKTAELMCELIDNLGKKEERAPFAPLIEDLCSVMKQVADSGDNTLINSLLQAMESDSGASVDFFKESIGPHLLPLLSTVAKSHKEEETQRLALETVVSWAEAKPKAMSKVPNYVQQTLEISIHFLMQMSEDLESWGKEDEETAEDEENPVFGKEVLDRLCRAMNGVDLFPMVLEILKPAIATLFQASQSAAAIAGAMGASAPTAWKQPAAGLTVLSQIVEYMDSEALVHEMMGVVRSHLHVPNPRIRHAAWGALGQFVTDHPEQVAAEAMAQEVLKDFIQGLDDTCPRVRVRVMEAFQLYGTNVDREVLEPFVEPMMNRVGQQMQTGELPVLRNAVTFIAVLAGQMEDGFAGYYAQVVPVLKQLVGNFAHNVEERVLLGKAFECLSLLAAAVGPEGFRQDAEGIMEAMIRATQVPNLPNSDPVKEYMLQASQRICATLKEGFLPFVPQILPGILDKLTLAPKECSAETAKDFGDDEEVNLTLTQENGQIKLMIMSTSEMEDLSNAVGCVHTFVEELGKSYAPFVNQTAQALLKVFEFSMDEEIRDTAFETWGLLCKSAREGGQAAIVTELVQEFLKRILPKLEAGNADGAEAAADPEALKTAAEGVKKILEQAGPNVLSVEQLNHVHQLALLTLNTSLKRRDAEEAEQRAQDGEEKRAAPDDEEGDEDDAKLRLACCEMAGSLMEHHPDVYTANCLPLAMQLVAQFIVPTVRWEDHRLALFVVCDILQHLRERATAHWPQFMPQLLQDLLHQSAAIRQPACYGMSLAAREPAFAPFAVAAATSLSQVVSQTRGGGKKKKDKPAQACADNALTAIIQILTLHKDTLQTGSDQLWSIWLQGLPCVVDEDEGMKNHKMLLRLVEAENVNVVGEGGKNVAQVLQILVDVYKTGMADDDTSKGIGQLVVKLGQQKLEQVAGGFRETQKKKLLRIHREAQ